jgi:L-lactate dehydrogenase complex protein LldE
MARVQLFATCLGDLAFPSEVADAEQLLRDDGYNVVVVRDACCGQPAFNSGHRGAAARVARACVRAFDRSLTVVVPSGSCATMLAHYVPELLGVEPYDVRELSTVVRGARERRLAGRTVAYHDSCHMLRELHVHDEPRALLEAAGAQVVPLGRPDLCCGFGGTFSVRRPEVSVAMADDKLGDARSVGAEALVTADPGCLLHLRGRAARIGALPVVHLASAVARGL